MSSSTVPIPVEIPQSTWGIESSFSSRELRIVWSESPGLLPMLVATIKSRTERRIPLSFRLNLGGTDFQLLLRLKGGVSSYSLPKGFLLNEESFDIILFRGWVGFRSHLRYSQEDYPEILMSQMKKIVVEAFRNNGYIDDRGQLMGPNTPTVRKGLVYSPQLLDHLNLPSRPSLDDGRRELLVRVHGCRKLRSVSS